MVKKITAVEVKEEISVKFANGKIVEMLCSRHKGAIGLLYNVSTWNGRTSCYFLNFKTGGRNYIADLTSEDIVRVLTDEQAMSVVPKDTDLVLKSIPLRGGICGADPEIFAVNKYGTIIPAFTFLPAKPKDSIAKGQCFWDGFQAEFTPSQGSCLAFFTDGVQKGLKTVLDGARKVVPGARLTWKCVLDITDDQMRKATPEQADLGCAPSLNAYTGVEPVSVDDPTTLYFRFAGCHVHMGIGRKTKEEGARIVKTIDAIWGPISISLFRGMEDPRRRAFYGRAGEFRLPKYGIEYRTPSSAMLSHPAVFHLCFEFIRAATQIALMHCGAIWKAREQDIVTCINYHDIGKADMILKQNSSVIKGIVQRRFGSERTTERAWKLIKDGALSYFGCESMEKDWYLSRGWTSHSDNKNCCVANIVG